MKVFAVLFSLMAAGLVAAAPAALDTRDPSTGQDLLPGDIKRSTGQDLLPGDIKRSSGEDPLHPGSGTLELGQEPPKNDNDKRGDIHWGHGPAKTSSSLDYPSPPKDN